MSWRVVDVDSGEPHETYVALNDRFAGCKNCKGVHKYYTSGCKPCVFFYLDGFDPNMMSSVLMPTPTDLIISGDFHLFDVHTDEIDVDLVESGLLSCA